MSTQDKTKDDSHTPSEERHPAVDTPSRQRSPSDDGSQKDPDVTSDDDLFDNLPV